MHLTLRGAMCGTPDRYPVGLIVRLDKDSPVLHAKTP